MLLVSEVSVTKLSRQISLTQLFLNTKFNNRTAGDFGSGGEYCWQPGFALWVIEYFFNKNIYQRSVRSLLPAVPVDHYSVKGAVNFGQL